ncbi:MAG: penicillin-binding protein 2 [Lentisphaeria bacterium]|nr:penicillin-binding protein 2 [Lentisphaeria bacterium]
MKLHQDFVIRIFFAASALLVLAAGLIYWLYNLQVVRQGEFNTLAQQIYIKSLSHTGNRGTIRDHFGNLLAGNENCKDIYLEPKRVPGEELPGVLIRLSESLDVDLELLQQRVNSNKVEIVIKKYVDIDLTAQVLDMKLADDEPVEGLRALDSERRTYPKRSMLANIIGFTDHENHGAFGLEQVFDEKLQQSSGKSHFIRAENGTILERQGRDPRLLDGHDIYLTIEEPLQDILQKELQNLRDEFNPTVAYAMLADPKTGRILAIAQDPSFDPNKREEMNPDHWRNRMISDVLEPGSTMKPIAITGAIQAGLMDINTHFYCEKGIWWYGGRPLKDAGHHYEDLTVHEIIQKSSNIGTAKIALAMGENRLYQTLRRFGFGERVDLGLPHESRGIFRKVPQWDKLSITRFPIGQGIAVTPVQMLQAYCALANDGRMMKLQLVDRIIAPNGNVVQSFKPEMKQQVSSPRVIQQVVNAMKTVTEEGGTARQARVQNYNVAGKTGTSQKWINGSYEGHGKYISSFIGFVPAEDPAFVLLVVADEPKGKFYGGSVCGPTFSRIAEQSLRYLNIIPPEVAHKK